MNVEIMQKSWVLRVIVCLMRYLKNYMLINIEIKLLLHTFWTQKTLVLTPPRVEHLWSELWSIQVVVQFNKILTYSSEIYLLIVKKINFLCCLLENQFVHWEPFSIWISFARHSTSLKILTYALKRPTKRRDMFFDVRTY